MIGEILGSYRLTHLIGKGGFGVVYAAEHTLIDRKAAVKLLKQAYSEDEEVVRRFFNEARATSSINHPGIVDIYEFGHHEGAAYLVMELLRGRSLASRVGAPLPVPFLLAVGRQMAAALEAAHRKGIIHRDLKPENVFLVEDPDAPEDVHVKLLDFGVAKLVLPATSISTRSGAVLGTPLYLSPEQCRGAEQVDPRSDLYALGCILFELATGRPPFAPRGLGDMMIAHLQLSPPAPRSLAPDVPPAVEELILALLSKDPRDRYQSAEELVLAIDELTSASQRSTRTGRPSRARLSDLTARQLQPPRPVVRRRWGRPLVWGLSSLAVIAAGLVIVLQRSRGAGAPGPEVPVAPGPAAVPSATPPGPAAPVPTPGPARQVRRSVLSEPPGADVVRPSDGAVLGRTPYSEVTAPSERAVPYVVRLAGWKEVSLLCPGDRDSEQRAILEPAPPPVPTVGK